MHKIEFADMFTSPNFGLVGVIFGSRMNKLSQRLKQLDNPWVPPVLLVLLPTYGLIFGFVFGPIFYPAPPPASGLDVYSVGNFTRNEWVGGVCLVIGFIVALGISIQLLLQQGETVPEITHQHEAPDM